MGVGVAFGGGADAVVLDDVVYVASVEGFAFDELLGEEVQFVAVGGEEVHGFSVAFVEDAFDFGVNFAGVFFGHFVGAG